MDARTVSARGPELEPHIKALSGETLVELLDRAVARTPESQAMVIRRGMVDERWSYRHLAEVVERVARTLREAGVGPGDRVLTWSQNDPWLVAAYFAVWRLGAIIVPLDLRMQTDVAVRIGRRARATILLAGPDVDRAVAAELDVPILAVDEAGLDPIDRRSELVPAYPEVEHSDIAEVIFTSGTTSDPKGVVLTHAQIVHTARALAQTSMGSRPDRALGIVPLSHMYGQTVLLLTGFMGGSTLVFLQALTPKAMTAAMQRERITVVTLAPQLISILLQSIEAEARRSGREASLERARRIARWLPFPLRRLLFRSVLTPLGGALEVIGSGGALLSEELQGAWEAFGIRILQGYGTTECAAVCGHTRARQRAGSVGPPLAGLEVHIAADGELLVRGPNVMTGYWEAEEATAEVLDAGGWFHTGDAARVDERGEIVILGRTRDRISLPNGLNVYPEDVEAALVDTGSVRAAVVFEPTPGRLAAAVVPVRAGADEAELDDAVRRANGNLAPHQRIGTWRRWPEEDFPRTHTLKVRRGPVQEWYAEAADGAGEAPALVPAAKPRTAAPNRAQITPEAVAAIVAEVMGELRGTAPPTITAETTVASLELDSLAAVSLTLRLDEAFEAPISDDEVMGARDISALHALVLARTGQPPESPPSRWAFSPPARALRRLLDATLSGWAIRMTTSFRVEGAEHLDGLSGPVLICPNHTSHLDAPVTRAALPPSVRDRSAIAAAADVWFTSKLLGPVVEGALGAIPFGRTSDFRASLERVADLVNDGYSVIIFPEGTRSADGHMLTMRDGVGLMATSLHIPVVPVYIDGAHEILPKGVWLPRRRAGHHVTLRFGAPIHVDAGAGVHDVTEQIRSAIEDLAGHGARP
jgi:long-chain acyl-CoA synthetase